MIALGTDYGIFRDRLAFFPDEDELAELVASMRANELLRVRQTSAPPPGPARLVFETTFMTTCVDLTQPLDALYQGMDRTSCRYLVRKAGKMKDSIAIRRNDAEACADFARIQNSFGRINGHSADLSQRRIDGYRAFGDVFTLYFKGEPICCNLVLCDRRARRARCLYYASRRLEDGADAALIGALMRYIHWDQIQTYKAEGMELYDFGGIEDGATGIAKFKLSFGGSIVVDRAYYFATGLGRVAYKVLATIPSIRSVLRGRLPT